MARKDIIDTSSEKFFNLVESKRVMTDTKFEGESQGISSGSPLRTSSSLSSGSSLSGTRTVVDSIVRTGSREVVNDVATDRFAGQVAIGNKLVPITTTPTTVSGVTVKDVPVVVVSDEITKGTPVVVDQTEDQTEETWVAIDNQSNETTPVDGVDSVLTGGGSGGGSGFGEDETEEGVQVTGGYVQPATGITVTGWVYPYKFVALTLACGAIGLFIGYKFKKELLIKLSLVAAGLMAGSAIGMKTFPPVKVVS